MMQLQAEKMCTKWEEEMLLTLKINQNIEERLGNNFHVIAKQNPNFKLKSLLHPYFPNFSLLFFFNKNTFC